MRIVDQGIEDKVNMPLIVRCPSCHKKLSVPSRYAGQFFDCPACENRIEPQSVPHEEAKPSTQQAEVPRENLQWYIHTGDRTLGPYGWAKLHSMAERGLIEQTTLVGTSPGGPWRPAVNYAELFPEDVGEQAFGSQPRQPNQAYGQARAWTAVLPSWIPRPERAEPTMYLVAIALLVVTCLALGYTATKSAALFFDAQYSRQRKEDLERRRQLREMNREIREENHRNKKVVGDEGFQPEIEIIRRESYASRWWARQFFWVATWIWRLYLLGTFALAGTLLLLKLKLRDNDPLKLIEGAAIVIFVGVGYLAVWALWEMKKFSLNEMLLYMEVLRDRTAFTYGYLLPLSLLGLLLGRQWNDATSEKLGYVAIGLWITYLFAGRLILPFITGVAWNLGIWQFVNMTLWTACLGVNSIMYLKLSGRAYRYEHKAQLSG